MFSEIKLCSALLSSLPPDLGRVRARRAWCPQMRLLFLLTPLSVNVDCYGTQTRSEPEILEIIHANFDMRAGMLVRELDMLKPKYSKTAAYGHFGNAARASDPDFTWETPKKLNFGAAKTAPSAGGATLPAALSEHVITNLLDQIDTMSK